MMAVQNRTPGDTLHAALTARLRRVAMRRWQRGSRGSIGAWRLTGGLQQRCAERRASRIGRGGLQAVLRVVPLGLPLCRRWRGSQDVYVRIQGVPVVVALHGYFRSQFVRATTIRLAEAGLLRRETVHLRTVQRHIVRTVQRASYTEHRWTAQGAVYTQRRDEPRHPDRPAAHWTAQGIVYAQRQYWSRYLLPSGSAPAVSLAPHVRLVLQPLSNQKRSTSVAQEPWQTTGSHPAGVRAAGHGMTTVRAATPQLLAPVFALNHTVQTILRHLDTLRASAMTGSGATWLPRRAYVAPRLPAPATARAGTRSRTFLTLHQTSMMHTVSPPASGLPPLRLARRAAAAPETAPAQFFTPTPLPLIAPMRPALAAAPDSVEHIQGQITTHVLKRLDDVVAREIHRHLRFDSQDVRRLRERLYTDLGSRIVFERERLGRM